MEEKFNELRGQFLRDLKDAAGQKDLDSLRVKYLGRKSALARLFSQIPSLAGEQRSAWGGRLNAFKKEIAGALKNRRAGQQSEEKKIDLTFPAKSFETGSRHVLSSTTGRICSIFRNLGFMVAEGNEIEEEWYNFEALNIPLEHPSRDAFDTFYLNIPAKDKGGFLLRSHTSPSQIRVMQQANPPLAVISPGRVYRPDEVDATHSFMFHQIEGFVVGKDINFSHLKGVLLYFARNFFSPDVKLRFRPHFFPFTEPSAEVDLSCIICGAEGGGLDDKRHTGKKCSVCKGKGWLEILGCGMIHPRVLSACGINPREYKGFAFGMGIERIAMLKYNISDIRIFYDNDVRFLKQFTL